jgi:hypothetical protein
MKTIGRREYIIFSDFKDEKVEAKIDTGAYTSSLHAKVLGKVELDGEIFVRFIPFPEINEKEYVMKQYREKEVKSTSGHSETRSSVKLHLRLFSKKYLVEFTLTDRGYMKHPVLIGRKFLNKKFLVDVSQEFISIA